MDVEGLTNPHFLTEELLTMGFLGEVGRKSQFSLRIWPLVSWEHAIGCPNIHDYIGQAQTKPYEVFFFFFFFRDRMILEESGRGGSVRSYGEEWVMDYD